MNQSLFQRNTHLLWELMQQAKIADFKQLTQVSGVSELQLLRLCYGLLPKMPVEILVQLSQALGVTVNRLLATFMSEAIPASAVDAEATSLAAAKQEYKRLQQQMEQQQQALRQVFEQESLQVLEPWLLQWPSAAAAVKNNPELPAERLLPLVKPVEQLLRQWNVEAIASVGEEVAFDPQQHQVLEGTAQSGDRVIVRYVGYRQGDKLLHRAKVSPA